MFRQLLEAGYHPEHLPRLIGWSWESRKRVPGLMRQFINEICADTNPAVRLEGLYLAVLQAPNDAAGTLQQREAALVSAMWENRQWLFSSPENVSLVERTRKALRTKFDYPYPDPNGYFGREPFASFQHRLRMDFLAHASETNLPVFMALFPNTSEQMETSAEARELLPLAVSYQQKLHSSPIIDWPVKHLRQIAGVADAGPSEPAKTAVPAEPVLAAKFVEWNLPRSGIAAERRPNFRGMIVRNGQLWLRVRYLATNGTPAEFQTDFQTTYLAVDPQKGVEAEIPFPSKLGTTDDAFEVAADSLFVIAQGRLYRFKFEERTWDEIPAPVGDSSQLVWLKGSLFVARSDGLLKVNPASQAVEVLASSRRQPALNEIDPLWTAGMQIYPRSDGELGALSKDYCFCFDPDTKRWNIRTLPVAGTNNYFGLLAFFASPGGAQILLTGAVAHRYLVGYWSDSRPPESLLMEPSPFKMKDSPNERLLQPVRWDWPQGFPLEPSSIVAGDHELWILCPRKVWQNDSLFAAEPLKFSDDRQATLFCFEPEFRQPLSVAIRFEDHDLAVVSRRKINGRIVESFSPADGGFPDNWDRLVYHVGNAVFWVKTPEGLVFGAPNYCGHWLIPTSALKARMQTQRQTLNQSAKTQAPVPVNLAKP